EIAPEGTAILVIGNQDDWWHEQLWAPTVSDKPFVYDDWLWYWNTEHPGPFDYRNGTYYPDPSQALTDEYFSVHGIGAVVVTDRGNDQGMPQRVAQSSELLDQQDSIGAWDVFAVRALNPLVTDGDDAPASVELANGRIAASFDDGDGTV